MGRVPVPKDTEEIIFRLTNTDAEGMAQTTRVENEVAIIALASAAFAGSASHVVPSGLGGVTFDDNSHIVSSAMTSVGVGPWPTYESSFKATNNILFDATSNRVTALIDYDFACISHPLYEFLRSFDGAGGQFKGWSSDEASDAMALRDAKLHGFPLPLLARRRTG
ncbi:hypothetical protein V495_00484 [Pseudogymnoascus sp. VKM F-4514 (FW-929)]|nr:hypothetical protein V495_00484 [Pseudogymnoascus sp. VKM F-4514 (FW-929)]KFY66431.1 hypothetical protein V497_00887 [Pseudogymnoascus sp. VKM F-4516 (FW-969)]